MGYRPGPGDGLPPILPGLILALVVATLACVPLGRRLRAGPVRAWLLLAATGFILAITLTPSRAALDFGISGTVACDLSRIGPASWEVYRRLDDPTLNVLMVIPLGFAIGLLDRSPHRRFLIGAALLLPWLIEMIQAIVVPLGRACQAGDIFDNTVGLLIGLSLGLAAATLWRRSGGG